MNERNENAANEEFAGKAKALFDESVESLDGETRSRLNRGRHAALAELDSGSRSWSQWAPAAGVAAAAILVAIVWTGSPEVDDLAVPPEVADMEILLTEDSFEMLEDLEFYSWIELDEETEGSLEPENNVG